MRERNIQCTDMRVFVYVINWRTHRHEGYHEGREYRVQHTVLLQTLTMDARSKLRQYQQLVRCKQDVGTFGRSRSVKA